MAKILNLKSITSIFLLFNTNLLLTQAINCDDGNPCTSDYFDYISAQCVHVFNQWSGCEYQPPQQQQCSEFMCNRNGNKCKVFRNCNMGSCIYRDIDCNDYNPLTNDHCDPEFGCYHTTNTNQRSCSHDYECNDNLNCSKDQCINNKCVNTINCGFDQLCNRFGNCESIPRITNK